MAADLKTRIVMDTSDAKKGIDKLSGAFKALVAGASIKEFVSLGDEFTQITNRLKSVSDSSAEASRSFELVKQVAGATRSDLGSVADLFTDLTIATEEMGLSQQDVAGVAGTFSKALKISGADAGAASGAIRQFGQALASGVLRGDEFNSIMEANPAFMRAVAKQLDVNVGKLREMAAEGQLTSDVLVKATQEISGSIDDDFGKTVATVGESITNLRNNFIEFIGKIQEKTGVFTIMSDAINTVADNLNIVVGILAAAFGAMIVGQIITVTKSILALGEGFKGAAKAAAIMQGIIGGPAGIAKVLGGLVAGGGALYLMDQIFEDTAESTEDLNNKMEDLQTNADNLEKTSKEMLEDTKEKTKLTKEEKAAADELVRITERQKEEFEAITGELEIGRDELQRQLDLQNDLIFATDSQKNIINAIADLESDRTDELRDLAALTTVSNAERLAKEQEINEEYDARIKLTKDQLELQNRINRAGESFKSTFEQAFGSYNDALMSLEEQEDIINANSMLERDRLKFTQELYKNIVNEKIQLVIDLAEQEERLAEKLGKKRSELSDEEKAKAKAMVQERIDDNNKAHNVFMENSERFLEKFDEMTAKSREFGAGFKEAFLDFEDQVTNSAAYGARIFDTMASGFESAILNFVETGKLSFKDLFKSLLVEIIKMQANRLFLALFSPQGGVFGSLFAGFFNQGGYIPAGQIGIAGENGPEVISGPAHITSTRDTARMLGGGVTNIYYRIEATDPASFQAQVARDPEFIYNVTQAGAKRSF